MGGLLGYQPRALRSIQGNYCDVDNAFGPLRVRDRSKLATTLEAIERELVTGHIVYRYRVPDGLEGNEGAFSACSFWYAECLARAGMLEKARLQFEKTLADANPLGIFFEEIGLSGEHLGNFPQAFTHLALVSAAFYVDRELSGVAGSQWRP